MLTRLKLLHQTHSTLQERIYDWQMSPPKFFTKISKEFGDIDISQEYSDSHVLGHTSLSFVDYWHMLITGNSNIYNVNKIRKQILQIRGLTLKCTCEYFCHGEILCYLADHWSGAMENGKIVIEPPLHFRDLLN